MACPRPQPGHQEMPMAFKGHKLKWLLPTGLVKARQVKATIQNINSKYRLKSFLINLVAFGGQQ